MEDTGSMTWDAITAIEPPDANLATADDPLLGSVLDSRYLIERVVGRGGFGTVYRAVHLRFDSPVAIKVLRISSKLGEAERQRFIRVFLAEGKLLFTLGALHPSIVRVFETGTLRAQDGLPAPYFVMEWLDGVPLDLALRRRAELAMPRFEPGDIIDLLSPCVEGLARTHEHRIAHCDIKPGNIFLVKHDEKLSTKLLDFGLAKAATDTSASGRFVDSSPTDASFTPAYGAPEQWLKRLGGTGPWTDVYALALVCVELLSGARALQGGDGAQLMACCLDESARPTPGTRGVPTAEEVEAVFRKALAVDPRSRYLDVGAFWQALRDAVPRSSSNPIRSVLDAGWSNPWFEGCGPEQNQYGAAGGGAHSSDMRGAELASAKTDPVGPSTRKRVATRLRGTRAERDHGTRWAVRAVASGLMSGVFVLMLSTGTAGERASKPRSSSPDTLGPGDAPHQVLASRVAPISPPRAEAVPTLQAGRTNAAVPSSLGPRPGAKAPAVRIVRRRGEALAAPFASEADPLRAVAAMPANDAQAEQAGSKQMLGNPEDLLNDDALSRRK